MAVSYCSYGDRAHFGIGEGRRPAPPSLDNTEEAPVTSLEDGAAAFTRQISASPAVHSGGDCRLVDCAVPSPTCADVPETPRLEFSEFRKRATQLAKEFFCSRDCPGMVASIAALGCPSFHDELTELLLRASMDRGEAEREAVVGLLNALSAEGLLSGPQVARGFEKLVLCWDDLQLDVPDAPGQIAALLSERVGLLDRGLFVRLPQGLLCKLRDGLPQGSAARAALEAHLAELVAFVAELHKRLEADLFQNQSFEAIASWLRQVDKAAFHHEVVLAACCGSLGIDTIEQSTERQRRALLLLSHLNSAEGGGLLCDVDLQLGFSRLLGMLQGSDSKLRLEQVTCVLRSAVEHEILPAEFLKSARRMRFGGLEGVEAVRRAQRQTPLHSRRVWGSGDARQFRAEVREAILEYFISGSIQELAHIVEELHLSEIEQAGFLRKLMVTGMERGDADTALDAVSGLLGQCWTMDQVRQAFVQLRDVAEDLVLDFPRCRESTTDLVWAAVGRGLLDRSDLICDGATIV
mmetsp:Transcript_128724/g.321175  ORF Transcript_128724/g.321175 Transcript_128724/m.321175 type:complete len:522 (+) Transcript_128724:63-1628(+)|eukprot:CAMPEP_0115448954 /NCGR_PEP_ID=MMETSP0271-20121206/40755_1 /TAXON_ID=71861 /ORGANISM="Scrippsiella trochoidea, Strain CCMP3099" /LENGTH=521 /DNA_ID=CAMNT_0002875087 /DNA_START=61 /DNA_END=1626 /DNA_ORIENTATION=-